ncbi:hypothetical protein SRHO_G00212430 [Serrasalmus rhombeus]
MCGTAAGKELRLPSAGIERFGVHAAAGGIEVVMEEKWENVYTLLSVGLYPTGYNKSQRQNLRRYAPKFHLKDGELFNGKRKAIKNKEVAKNLFKEFHSSPMGGHTGIIKTRNAICSRFYWQGMSVDIDNWFAEHFLLTGRIDGVETTSLAVSAARMEIACSLLKCRGNAEDYCVICTMLQGDANKSMVEMHWPALVSDRCRGFTENSRRTDGEEPSFPAPALLRHSELRAPARGKRGKFAASVIITCYTCVHHASSLAGQFSRVL